MVTRMRALVVVNPQATTTTERVRDVLLDALAHRLSTEVVYTAHRDHATDLAFKARQSGYDIVVCVGGDGTVNEVVNGLLAEGPGPDVPALALVPGGSTNVLARNLGIPCDPVEATGSLLAALRTGRRRSIGLGMADDRWFTFCAGFGLDAAVVGAVEDRRREGARSTLTLYGRTAVSRLYGGDTDRRHGAITVKLPGREPVRGVFAAVVANCSPWTYAGPRAIIATPEASFDTGLDVLALTSLGTVRTLRHVGQLLRGRGLHGPHAVTLHDADEVLLQAAPATAFQLDGDHLGDRSEVRLSSVPDAIEVLA